MVGIIDWLVTLEIKVKGSTVHCILGFSVEYALFATYILHIFAIIAGHSCIHKMPRFCIVHMHNTKLVLIE